MRAASHRWSGAPSTEQIKHSFYRDLLGICLEDEAPGYAWFLLYEAGAGGGELAASDPLIGLLVDGIDEAHDDLTRAGVGVSPIEEWRSSGQVHRWCFFSDPEGHRLLLMERDSAGSAPYP